MLTALLDAPYFSGSTSTGQRGFFPISVNGHYYKIDTSPPFYFERWNHQSIPLLRQQADPAATPAEGSLNPDGLWRRAQDSWHLGAGQTYRDRDADAGISPYRFRSSKGMDVWTKYQLAMLPATTQKRTSSNTNLALITAGARLYMCDGANLYYTTDITAGSPTWTAVTGYTGGSVLSIASDGYTIYFSDGANIWTTNTGTGAGTSADTTDAAIVAYVKGRLMVAGTGATKNVIYNITTIGSAATMTFTHANADFTWVGFAEGPAHIYAAGYSGDKSIIYRIGIKADASSLDQPVVAGSLPSGEIVRSIQGYLGYLLIGTDTGFRFAQIDGQGNLVIGSRVAITSAVRCFEAQDKFVWFGWTNYDSTSTGLGRMDTTRFTDTVNANALTPAYASDLMAGVSGSTVQGNVLSVATFQSLRVFAVSASGIWCEDTTKVPTATLSTGLITYGLPDNKTAMYIDTKTLPLAGSWTIDLATNSGAFSQVAATTTASSTAFSGSTGQEVGEWFELRVNLTRDAVTTTGPTMLRYTLKSLPAVSEGPVEMINLPLFIHSRVEAGGTEFTYNVATEVDFLKGLHQSRTIVSFSEHGNSYVGVLEDYRWVPLGVQEDYNGMTHSNGTFVAQFKRIA